MRGWWFWWGWWPALLWASQPPVSLDEVYCALCHFEQGDQFSESLHYQSGQLLCNDCHGGLQFEADAVKAKAPGTGFIGKPRRQDIASLCGKCHSGPASAFARGPHADWGQEGNPTCITCHHNHRVKDATLALMDSTCSQCHPADSAALERGAQVRQSLEEGRREYSQLRSRLDSLRHQDGSSGRAAPRLEAAAAALREADPLTHALDPGLIGEKVKEARQELGQVQGFIDEYFAAQGRHRWIAAGIWAFVGVNVVLLWRKRRQLK